MSDRDFGELNLNHCGRPEKSPQPKDDLRGVIKLKPSHPSLCSLSAQCTPAWGPSALP